MVKLIILVNILLLSITTLFSQIKVTGHIYGVNNGKPVSYVNIGILNSNIGTISNEDGSFSIVIPSKYSSDTLLLSAIGYATKSIPVSSLNSSETIMVQLFEKATLLEKVTVTATGGKRKTYLLGNKYNRGGYIYADSIAAGSAMALLIENKYPSYHADLTFPFYIDNAALRISVNTLNEFKIRIRFLEVDTITNLPGKDMFDENVIMTSRIKKGWLKFDLSQYRFKVEKPFFLVFEWIQEDKHRLALIEQYNQYKKQYPEKVSMDSIIVQGEQTTLTNWNGLVAGTYFGVSPLKFSLDNFKSYYRTNSFGEWKRSPAILTARVQASKRHFTENKK